MKIITTIGDPNGIGLETFVKAIKECDAEFFQNNYIAIASSPSIIENYLKEINFLFNFENQYLVIDNKKIEIINIDKDYKIEFGTITNKSAEIALSSLECAAELVLSKKYNAMLTLPISKNAMHLTEFPFQGHTEYLAAKDNAKDYLMILFNDKMRVALATIHIPLKDVAVSISEELLENKITNFIHSLKIDFATDKPKIALLALNPHAGENGDIGREEIEIIIPIIEKFRNNGNIIDGPFPADSFFAHSNWHNYDGIFAMYHDQGLIPMKMTNRNGGVNFTAGLSFVRTSPDHGTGFDIAGKNIADCKSTLQALIWAEKISRNRLIFNV
ncbi:MAG TPA: 4-hydroxythreonine-4-phosphate dehydrogenase PdxA [Bacteroidota bacterium]|nr:4-hydroxythreonine-4-phosphate dehydrogenase PdxA [Bacteroidota bacterium]